MMRSMKKGVAMDMNFLTLAVALIGLVVAGVFVYRKGM